MGKQWWFLIGIIVLISGITRHNLLLLVGLFLALVGGAAHLWARYCLVGVSYRRYFGATRLFHGEETDLIVEVINAKPLPLAWLIAIDDFPSQVELLGSALYLSSRPRRRLLVNSFSLRWYERIQRRYRMRGLRRGAWEFGPVHLSSGDIFGFSVKRQFPEEKQIVVVYPKIVPLTTLGLPDRHPFGEFKTQRRFIEDPLQLAGARAYTPGDSFRHIHWKATARRRVLQTKIFLPSASRALAIFLNSRTTEFANEGIDREILELAVITAASIAHWSWQGGQAVGLYVNSTFRSSQKRIRIHPKHDSHQFNQILEALAWMEEEWPWSLSALLELEGSGLRYGTSIVVITPLLNHQLLKVLMELQRREYGITLITLGATELNPDVPGIQYYHIDRHEVGHELEGLELA